MIMCRVQARDAKKINDGNNKMFARQHNIAGIFKIRNREKEKEMIITGEKTNFIEVVTNSQ